MRPILYISGPYSAGYGRSVAENIAVARAHAEMAWRRGWAAICPHLNTAHFEETCPSLSHDGWLNGDLTIISRLDPYVDAMLLLPGWMQSTGAMREYQRARSRGLEIIYPVDSPECIPSPGNRAGPVRPRGDNLPGVED